MIFLAVRTESTIVCFVCRFSSCVRRGWEENHFISAMTERVTLSNDLLLSEVALMLSEGCTVTLLAKGSSMFPFIIGGCDRVVLQKQIVFKWGILYWHILREEVMCYIVYTG